MYISVNKLNNKEKRKEKEGVITKRIKEAGNNIHRKKRFLCWPLVMEEREVMMNKRKKERMVVSVRVLISVCTVSAFTLPTEMRKAKSVIVPHNSSLL